jgi:hypothetical protein
MSANIIAARHPVGASGRFLRQRLLIGCALTVIALAASAAETDSNSAPVPARIFAQPDRIRYDGHCLTIDGQDTFIFSGAFHYFRCPKPLWRERFQKIKDAGFNAVETYVPWNWSEREQPAGLDDFSKIDLTDLKDWLKMAQDEFGLYTIIRPGPYICAEWDEGGFPRWLLNFKPEAPKRTHMWLRSDDPVYLAWCKHWYDAVCPVIAAEQITRKPKGGHGVILFQIENEYDGARGTADERVTHLHALYQDAKDNGIEVPVFTCWTHDIRGSQDPLLSQAFDCVNEYPSWNVTRVRSAVLETKLAQPSAPGMVPELQGGWFTSVGGSPNTLTAAQINAVTLMAYAGGATLTSYYMLYGGSNPEGFTSRGLISSYDYNAPIRESGGVGERYLAVKAIGNMLQKYGPELARADLIPSTVQDGGKGISFDVRRNPDGHTFVFCFNPDRKAPAKGNAVLKPEGGDAINFSYNLEPFGMKVLCLPENDWQPQAVAAPDRPAAPASVPITSALVRAEAGAKGWRPVGPNDSLSAQGVFDTRSVLYRARVSLTKPQADRLKTLNLLLYCDDRVVARVNGQMAPASQRGRRVFVDVAFRLRAGKNEIEVFYENPGQPDGSRTMEDLAGLQDGGLSPTADSGQRIENWRVKLADDNAAALCATEVDDSAWPQFQLTDSPQGAAGHILDGKDATAVFRASLDLPATPLPAGARLLFERIDEQGDIFINGQPAGRAIDQTQTYEIPGKFFKPGHNQIAVAVKSTGGAVRTPGNAGGLTLPVIFDADSPDEVPLNWEMAPQLGGVTGKWWQNQLSTSGWRVQGLGGSGTSPVDTNALAAWYRLEFELPAADPHVWVPWGLELKASGNGWIYLNGHSLGRYWEAGPQRKFFLPACWLNFGPGAKNNVTLCLRHTDRGPSLDTAEVTPYAEFAERRQVQLGN